MAKKIISPFQIGDRVTYRGRSEGDVLTVVWSSKNPASRDDQLIATEHNGHWNTCSEAVAFELVQP